MNPPRDGEAITLMKSVRFDFGGAHVLNAVAPEGGYAVA